MPLLDSFQFADVDGVPVVWTPSTQPLSASLVFRVGRADESFLGGGVTHLVEHLVMRGVGRMPIEANAHVSTHTTTFVASGSAHHVVDFLARVCRQLAALDTAPLEVERRVLRAEESGGGCGPAGEAASLRYGCRGAGLLAYRDMGVRTADADTVRDWSARYFTRGNAVLALVGDVPADLRLALPPGERMPLVAPLPRPLDLPAWDPQSGGTAVSLPVAGGTGMDLAVGRLLSRAATDLVRHEKGLAYHVDHDGVAVDAGTSEVALFADNDEERAEEVAALLLDVVRRVAERGPTPQEIADDEQEALEQLGDPRGLDDAVGSAAYDVLLGETVRSPAEMYEQTRRRTAEDVREAVAAAADRLLVLLPGETELAVAGLRRLAWSSCPVPAGRELRPRLFKGLPGGSRLVVGDTGLALRLPEGDLVARWDDVVGVTYTSGGDHVVQSGDGPAVPVFPRDWRGGDAAVAEIRRRVPEHLFVPEPDEDGGEGAA